MNGLRDALDAAWGDFPTNDIGYDWKRYTGNARPDAGWCDAVVRHSRLTFIMETYSGRSREPAPAGSYDCAFAEQRARERHPNVASIAVVVSDGDGGDNWNAYDYGFDWGRVASVAFYPYGAVPICASFLQGARDVLAQRGLPELLIDGDWVPETWGAGSLLSQVVGYTPIDNTDLNHVWAPYYPSSPPPPPPPRKKAKMHLYSTTDDGVLTYYRDADGILVPLAPEEAAPYYEGILAGDVVVIALGGVLAALAFNDNTIVAKKKLGLVA